MRGGVVLSREEVVEGLPQEMAAFSELLRSLNQHEFDAPSRCEGWSAGDVARHLAGAFVDIREGRVEGQGTAEVSERQVAERRGRSAKALADEIDDVAKWWARFLGSLDDNTWTRPARGGYPGTLGQGMAGYWLGTYIHADDIRTAIGRPSERGPGLRAGLLHVADLLAQRGWGPAVLALDGMEEIPVGTEGDVTRRITGDPLAFLLVATGRADPTPLGLDESVNVFAEG
jgi:uncharacterized protein (TIGR03083 family)